MPSDWSPARRVEVAFHRAFPMNSNRHRWAGRFARAAMILARDGAPGLSRALRDRTHRNSLPPVQVQYDRWRQLHEPSWVDLNRMRHRSRSWTPKPLVSVILPVFEAEPQWIREAVESVLGQVYETWELCIADDASLSPHVGNLLREYAGSDPRIKVITREVNGGIAAASQSALQLAHGDFIALLDHDDLLRPHALYAMVERSNEVPEADVLYSDEDLLLTDGQFGQPFFKPNWSPSLLLSVNYICHLLMVRRDLVERVGGFREGFDGAQDHDLLLRVTEQARKIEHIADVLYAWRQVQGSVALDGSAKAYAYEAGARAVEDALTRRRRPATVTPGIDLGRYDVRFEVSGRPQVGILIPTRDRVDLLRECIASIEKRTSYPEWGITIVDNGSVEEETLKYLAETPHRVVRDPGEFNYSRLVNTGRVGIGAPYLLTLNNDVTVITPDWLEALLEQIQDPGVGVVGARLLFPDGRPQHEGIAVGNVRGGYIAANLDAGWLGRVTREVTAVTGACQMIRSAVFDEVGGYDEQLAVSYNDVDFCLRVTRAGYGVVYTPHAVLTHSVSASRGTLDPVEDHRRFWDRWGAVGGIEDGFLSPHIRELEPLELRLGKLAHER